MYHSHFTDVVAKTYRVKEYGQADYSLSDEAGFQNPGIHAPELGILNPLHKIKQPNPFCFYVIYLLSTK